MKKIWMSLLIMACLFVAGCGNGFAKSEYDANDKIAETEDRYAKEDSVFNPIDGGYSLTVSKFDGRETLWSESLPESKTIEISFSFSLSKGQAKVVHIDEKGNVTTIIECAPETSTDAFVTQTVLLESGQNRLKLVGYDCEDLTLEMLFEEPK